MKRLLSVLLAACVIMTAAGCSKTETSDGATDTSAVQSDSVADAAGDTSSATESTTAATESTTSAAESTTAATEVTSAPEQQPDIDYSALTEEEIYDLMVERSLITTGDMTRMANVLDRAAKGETITAAYIGGSITEGYHDNLTLAEDQKWAKMSTTWLSEQFPTATVNYVNAGLSGTPSILGNMRLERDVLASDPDIVFVEFAVNDGNANEFKYAYESLVRTLLTQDKDIAVVLLFTIVESGHTCQPHMTEIGKHYGLPMISLPDSMWVEIQEGRMTWDDYSGDQSHPHVEGSKLVRDLIINYYENVIPAVADNVGEVDKTLPDPLFSDDYMNMHFLESTNLEVTTDGFVEYETYHWFKNGWFYKGDKGASLKFTVDCSKLAMVFKANNSKVYGDAQIFIDGVQTTTVSSNMESGWNNPETQYIINESEPATHEVEIVVEGGTPCCFYIMGFGYCE